MTEPARQLVLELPHRPALALEDFLVSGSNAEAVALVDRWPDWPAAATVISGPPGCGKSHLANVWRLRSDAVTVESSSIDAATVASLFEPRAVVVEAIDNVRDEPALFHMLNLAREKRFPMLLTSRAAPGELAIRLPDLSSRLKALPHAAIDAPDDALLRAVLVKLFADRQLSVDPAVIAYLLVRMERSMDAARRIVAEVDRQSLAMQRSVTRAVAAAALDSAGFAGKT